MVDKRKFERFEINVPVKIKIFGEGKEKTELIETRNVSAAGLLITSLTPIPEGSRVEMEIFLDFEKLVTAADPDGTLVLSVTGRVLRSGAEGTAIRFNKDYEFMIPDKAGPVPD
jgi:hypothetical protein